jgi:hypothetical protein
MWAVISLTVVENIMPIGFLAWLFLWSDIQVDRVFWLGGLASLSVCVIVRSAWYHAVWFREFVRQGEAAAAGEG